MALTYKEHLQALLLKDERVKDEQGELKGNVVKEFANKLDEILIETLLLDDKSREKFFLKIKDFYVFKANDFKFYLEQNSLDNSFTNYAGKTGEFDHLIPE
jgi:adenine-specific DNA-methyltransferase